MLPQVLGPYTLQRDPPGDSWPAVWESLRKLEKYKISTGKWTTMRYYWDMLLYALLPRLVVLGGWRWPVLDIPHTEIWESTKYQENSMAMWHCWDMSFGQVISDGPCSGWVTLPCSFCPLQIPNIKRNQQPASSWLLVLRELRWPACTIPYTELRRSTRHWF